VPAGIADELVNERLAARLTRELQHVVLDLDPAEADRRISQYVAEAVARAVQALPVGERARRAAELANHLIALLNSEVDRAELEPGHLLRLPPQRHVASYLPSFGAAEPIRPVTPLTDTILFTNASAEPNLASEITREIASAD